MAKTPKPPRPPRQPSTAKASTQMSLMLTGGFLFTVWLVGAFTGIDWTEETRALLSPSSYQYGPNQNYCVVAGRERYVPKPGQSRRNMAPCVMDVQSGEGMQKFVTLTFLRGYSSEDLQHDLPSGSRKYSIWRRKIYNGEVEQARLASGDADDIIARGTISDLTVNPGYMAYFIIPGSNAQECGDNVDLSICKKLLLGEVLWW